MSGKKVRIVRLEESKLVELIDGIVTEAVALKKKEWIAEQASKGEKNILENRIKSLEKKIASLTESKSATK